MKKILNWPILFLLFLCLTGCGANQQKYDRQFFDLFDTVSTITVYAGSQKQADKYFDAVHERLLDLHRQFDPYNTYDTENLKTLNDMAGKGPVTVPEDLHYLLSQGQGIYDITNGKVNIAMGATLELWHKYRDNALENNIIAVPSEAELEATRQFDDISALAVLPEYRAYIEKEGVSVNLGAVAKGYAAEAAVITLRGLGCDSALINLGGNVACYRGRAKDTPWKVGIQDPFDPNSILEVVEIDEGNLVSSGDYQRYYMYNGKKIHHIIDPETLMPAEGCAGTTVIMVNGGGHDGLYTDMLSTALFIMSESEGRDLADKYFGIEQIYRITPDGNCKKFY